MNPRSNRTSNNKGWPFRDSSNDGENSVSTYQRMVGQLLRRKAAAVNLPAWESRSLMSLGIEVSQSRDERTGRSMQEAAKRGGLDPAFFAILEAGKATPEEIRTPGVLRSLARSVGAKVADLESAMSVQESSYSSNTAGQIVAVVLSLCQPKFLNTAYAYKSTATLEISDRLWDDEEAGISYKIGGLSGSQPPSLVFYEFRDEGSSLQGWRISLRTGMEEIYSGRTDERGAFAFPPEMTDFPANAHMVIRRPE